METTLSDFIKNVSASFKDSWSSFIQQVPGILTAIIIVAFGLLLAAKLTGLSKRAISRKTSDTITINFLGKLIKLTLSALVIIYALKVAGLTFIATSFFAAAGASAVIVGFAFRDIGENFLAGIILSFNRPFNENDTVLIGDIFGRVKNIEFRYTKLKTFDGRDVYIPNSDVITKPVYNYTEDGFYRFDFIVGIGYEDDIDAAIVLIMEVIQTAEDTWQDPLHQSFVMANELSISTVNLKVHFWVKTLEYGMDALLVKSRVVSRVKRALLEKGFNLPADIKEIKLYGSQTSIPVSIQNERTS